MRRVRRAAGALVLVLGLAAGCAGDERATDGDDANEAAVPPGFFGINGQGLRPMAENGELERLDAHLATLAESGIDFVRANVDWPRIEPNPPVDGRHDFRFDGIDAWVGALAAHGLEWDVAVMGVPTPHWAADRAAIKVCGSRAAPRRPSDLAALGSALARRYGREGDFWRENPDLDPVPIADYELWNEPNLGSFWCPVPDPPAYAAVAEATADAIRGADPEARIVLGGLAAFEQTEIRGPGDAHISSAEFLERMLSARPALAQKIDVVGVHAYGAVPDGVFHSLAYQREAVDRAGLAGKPLSLNESGWYTAGLGATPPVTEEERAGHLADVASAVARSNCGVESFAPHTWVTTEANVGNIEDWYGIADPESGVPYASGQAYLDQVAVFEGRSDDGPPQEPAPICDA